MLDAYICSVHNMGLSIFVHDTEGFSLEVCFLIRARTLSRNGG